MATKYFHRLWNITENLCEKYLDSKKVLSYNDQLHALIDKVKDHKNDLSNISKKGVFSSALNAYHPHVIEKYSPSSKKGTILPSPSLFNESNYICRSISDSFCIWDISEKVSTFFLDIYLQAHDSIFSQIFICFSTSWCLSGVSKFKKGIHWTFLDCLPSKEAISTRKYWVEAKPTFHCFIRRMTQFILVKLSCSHQVCCKRLIWVSKVYFNFSTTPAT